jgi:hypothetical protein
MNSAWSCMQHEAKEEGQRRAAATAADGAATPPPPMSASGHTHSIDFGAVGSNTLPLFNAARNSTQFRSVSTSSVS